MKRKLAISVIVSVKNEELNLPNCLRALNDFSEVIVADSMSTDRTPTIVKEFNFKLVNFKWNGNFPKKRNWVLRNINILNDWVLFLDADEVVTEEFVIEVSKVVETSNHSGFRIQYNNYFMGRELKHGDRMSKLALFKKSSGEYENIEENSWSHLDMEIHEHPVLTGSIGLIKSPIYHNDFKSLEHYIAKHNAYSTWEANRYLALQNKDLHNLSRRQRIKYSLMTSGWLSVIYFTYSYFVKLGFLDGIQGYYFAKFKSYYFFQIQTKINEMSQNSF